MVQYANKCSSRAQAEEMERIFQSVSGVGGAIIAGLFALFCLFHTSAPYNKQCSITTVQTGTLNITATFVFPIFNFFFFMGIIAKDITKNTPLCDWKKTNGNYIKFNCSLLCINQLTLSEKPETLFRLIIICQLYRRLMYPIYSFYP